jgi:plastocyanin
MRALPLVGVFGTVLAIAAPAGAQTEVGANGNFAGGLSFTPAEVTVRVGDVVRWRNTDAFVPHTSTEVHGLWDLGGTYGGTPANPPGYGPGAVVERPFEAGSHLYYCRVHPGAMLGVVRVPVTLSKQTVRVRLRRARRGRRGKRRRFKHVSFIVANWAIGPPAEGLVFDVERRVGAATPWAPLRTGTRETTIRFRAGIRGTPWEVRTRLRRDGSQDAATEWSPAAAITG